MEVEGRALRHTGARVGASRRMTSNARTTHLSHVTAVLAVVALLLLVVVVSASPITSCLLTLLLRTLAIRGRAGGRLSRFELEP